MASHLDEAKRTALLNAMQDASPGDRSMLEAAIQHPADIARLVTTANSANLRLWSQMVQLGWMTQEPDTVLPEAPGAALKNFSLTDAGRAALPELLLDFRRHQSEHSAKMINLFRTLCLPFIKDLREQVTRAGGRGSDIDVLTALTLTELVASNYRAEYRLRGLENITKQVRQKLASEPQGSAKKTS